jgi:ribonuclease-3
MQVIKPGKLAIGKPKKSKSQKEAPLLKREVWNDFEQEQKNKKKKSYEKGSGNRMVPVSSDEDRIDESAEQVEEVESSYNPRSDFEVLEEKIGYTFSSRDYLERALTHRSALAVKERADYERLEFLGDAVLDLSIAHLLSDGHPEAREGDLSKMRAALVNTQALADIAQRLELGPFIRLGRGEHSSGGAERPSILADVMEAIIGAIYRDSTYDIAFETIAKIYGKAVDEVTPFDPKTELQEVLHAAGSEPPEYLLELVEGPEHAPTFITVVTVDGSIVGRGRGNTKKAAQQHAASEALLRIIYQTDMPKLAENQEVIIPEALFASNAFRASDK